MPGGPVRRRRTVATLLLGVLGPVVLLLALVAPSRAVAPPVATPAPALRLVALGDSVPAGTACGCTPFVGLLDRPGQGELPARSTSDLAVPGLTSAGLLAQLSDPVVSSQVSGADDVVLLVGANDFASDTVGTSACTEPLSAGCFGPGLQALRSTLAQVLSRVQAVSRARVVLLDYWAVFQDGDVDRQHGSPYVERGGALTVAVDDVIARCAAEGAGCGPRSTADHHEPGGTSAAGPGVLLTDGRGKQVVRVLAPDSWSSVVACGLLALVGLVVLARLGLRPLAAAPALLSVVAAALAGALAVNVSYDYYQHWSDALADVSGSAPGSTGPALGAGATGAAGVTTGSPGRLVSLDLGVRRAARPAVVWLPPAYDDPAHDGEKFPVLLLLHGDPGRPQGYVYGMHLDRIADELTAAGRLPATVVVMPTVSEGWPGQQCLDAVNGPDDETYLTSDVPAALERAFRVVPPGPSWVVAGLSEGGYCAADLALRHPGMFAGAGLLDGYYTPITSGGLGSRLFGAQSPAARTRQVDATPLVTVRDAPRGSLAFWVMHGTANRDDLVEARTFTQAATADGLPVRQVTVLGGTHSTPAWRTALPDLLTWATTLAAQGRAGTGSLTLPLAA